MMRLQAIIFIIIAAAITVFWLWWLATMAIHVFDEG